MGLLGDLLHSVGGKEHTANTGSVPANACTRLDAFLVERVSDLIDGHASQAQRLDALDGR
jgi:hypothetical protein